MSAPRASIVLPTFNGERDLARLLPALARQELPGGFEICAVDSSSTDHSRDLLARAGASVDVIPQPDFRHGATRNTCAFKARGEFLVFLSQDTEPANSHFLSHLLAAFADPRVAGAYSRVLPHPDDDPLTRRTALDAPEASSEPRDADARFNNVASAIRASTFRSLPFPDVAFGEDAAWAALAVRAGWRIRFVPDSVVYHAHAYSPSEAYERYRVDAQFHLAHSGQRVRPSVLSALRGFAHEVRADLRFLARDDAPGNWKHWFRSPALRGAQVFGQWVGSRGPRS
jgi:rhamnosyltransferase